jgi:hypothetical protein
MVEGAGKDSKKLREDGTHNRLAMPDKKFLAKIHIMAKEKKIRDQDYRIQLHNRFR